MMRCGARHRSWMEFGSALLHAPPYFDGERFCIVDAVFAPVFRYLDVFERIGEFGMLAGLSKVQAWRAALALRPSVQAAVDPPYPELLTAFLARRGAALSRHMREQGGETKTAAISRCLV
jgi:glutathione S-transferase